MADSNNDGRIDSLEWNPSAPDSDGDGTPDLYDFDDDGDGVPDDVDISPLVASKDNGGALVTFSEANPLNLTVSGLQANRYTYVSVQIRPTNPDYLWYAFNVLNWPKDEKGNMQDWDQKTFFDQCVATGGTNCKMTPDANGDIKLVPMLEVAVKDLSNLPRTAGGALDRGLLEKYSISVQPDGKGGYYLYVPLNLAEDKTTGAKVAFNAQLLYQAGATWQPQQARLSWGVQVLREQYASADEAKKVLDAGSGRGANQVTFLHAYYDDFHLTGLNVREDRGVQMAIVFEDPATDNNAAEDDALLHMMTGLGDSYLINRDCDFVDNQGQCVGDGQRDITIPVIKQRWDRLSNSGITDGQRWGIPANRLRVETYSFPHEDAATMIGGGTHAPTILNTYFTGTAAAKPSLLFVRESRFRATNLDSRAGSASAVTWSGQAVSVSLNGINEVITGGYNLAPYRYDSGAGWVRQTPQEAIAEVERRYPVPETASEDAKAAALGEQVSVVMVTSNAIQGTHGVLSQNGPAGLTSLFSSGIRFTGFDISDESMRNTYVQSFTAVGRAVPFLATGFMRKATTLSDTEWNKLVEAIFYAKSKTGNTPQNFEVLGSELKGVKWSLKIQRLEVQQRIALVQFWTGVGALLGAGIGLALTNLNNKGVQTAGQIVLATVTAVQSTVSAVTMFQQVANNARTLGKVAPGAVQSFTLSFRYALNSAFAKAGAVGAAIGGAVTWGLFFAAWGKGGLSADSVEFNSLLAGAIANTLMIVVTIFLGLSVVGAIILAVVAVFDLIGLIICKAGVKLACSLGLAEALTKLITDWIYTGGVMIDMKADPSLTNIEDAQMRLTDPARGLVVGNSVRFAVTLFTLARHAAPEPGIIYHYDEFFTPEDLGSTTVKYSLDTGERKSKPDLNQTTWWDIRPYSWVEAEVPTPVVGWLVPTTQSKYLYEGYRRDWLTSQVYPFNSAKINQTFPLYLNTGLALPRYDCWFQVCKHKAAKSSVSTDLGKSFILDILPATLDGFVAWSELGPQNDRDGDGVPARMDPDDTKWDTDGDGAPDGKELNYGSNPSVADADGDGLNDALEIRYGTHPRQADTDGDGISDYDEVNGYALTIGGRTIWTTSDPLKRDSDGDGISDGAERRLNGIDPVRYPFHPAVFNDAPARLYTVLDDADRVLALGATTVVTTTVTNGTAVENALMATGRFSATLPSRLGGAAQSSSFALLPTASKSIVLNGTVGGSASASVAITTGLAADLHAVGTAQSGPLDDIILDNPVPVTIDADPPDEPQLTLGQFVQPGNTVIIGGTASDPTSYVSLVDVAVGAGSPSPATGTSLWAFPVEIPNTPTGNVPITVRALDAVSNTRSANFSLTIDSVPPVLTTDLSAGALRQVRRNAAGEWTLRLTGTATDALAGMASLSVQIGTSSNVVITPTGVLTNGIAANGDWLLDYPFDDPSFTADPSPTGAYTATLTARDAALPDGNSTTLVIPFTIDMTPPVVTLLSHKDEMQLTDGAVITGTVQDAHAAVASVDFAFVDAATVFESAETLLNLPLNDLPGTVLFNNVAMTQTRIFCLDESCPTSGVPGEDGTAAQFDGQNDMLRAFETLELPESGLTTSLWFKTTNPNAGLFSAVQGIYPALTGHDRELFLVTGKVCASVMAGALREVRCSEADTYADGQWHQAVHSLGAGGNALYVDGRLAASSPTNASTFTDQERVLVGYAPTAAAPFLNGALDNVVIYNKALSARSVATLYRQWQPAALSGNQWAFTVPAGLEGVYQIDMRATDSVGNRVESRGDWPQFRGPVDTRFPTFDVSAAYRGSGSSSQTLYSATVRDANLTTNNYDFVCGLSSAQLRYETSAAQLAFTGLSTSGQLSQIAAQCTRAGFQTSLVAVTACDAFGHCGAATPPQTVAYIGTTDNRVAPFGSLPNAIERVNLSDPGNRVRLIERPGQVIIDIAVDESRGKLYWAEMTQGDYAQPAGVWRANLDGSGIQQAVSGQQVRDLALDPLARRLTWIDPQTQRMMRRSLLDGSETVLLTGLSADARGLVLRPERNELFYSNGSTLLRASVDGGSPVTVTALSGEYQGPSNLDPNVYQLTPIGAPDTSLLLGRGTPILSPCAVADTYEPNNAIGSATPLTVVTTTVAYGALCNVTIGQPTDMDYYSVTVPDGKTLAAALTELPADYRLVILHPAGYAAAFSENPGLADENGLISNTSGADQVYTVLVLSGSPVQNTNRYKLTLTLDDVPPPPDPDDAQCGTVDPYDAPAPGGNGTLATATPLSFGVPMAAALCYSADVDMYAFDGVAGQSVTLDLPTRPQDYELTLYNPAGAVSAVISPTTALTYGAAIQLAASGRYTVSVSQPGLTPTTDQYQLLVTDQNCVASDANEPNNDAGRATPVSNGSRVRATLCGSSDVDLYRVTATAGQQLTLNYPANLTGAAARVVTAAGGAEVGQATAGGQGVFTIPANGDYLVQVENGGLTSTAPYQFELLLGAATPPPAGSPYVYYSRSSDLIRADVAAGTVEPILLPDGFVGGGTMAADTARGKLYILDNFKRVVQVNPDGSDPRVVVATPAPTCSATPVRWPWTSAAAASTGRRPRLAWSTIF